MLSKIKEILRDIPRPIKNKYFIVSLVFIFWIVFLDEYNLNTQKLMIDKLNKLKQQEQFYIEEIKRDSLELYKLKNDSVYQEKFAREKFFMKKKNEDLFILRKK